MKKIVGILFINLFAISCVKEIDGSFLNTPNEIVLECFISPSDTIVKAVLSKATSFTDKETQFDDLFIKDAQIIISNAKVQKPLIYNSTTKYYELNLTKEFRIEKGVNYYINVITKEGKTLNSSCTVPSITYQPNDIEIEKSYRGTDLVDIRLKWPKSESKFFIVKPYYYYSNSQVKDKAIAQKVQFFNSDDIFESIVISNYFTNDLTVGGKKNTVFFYVVNESFFNYSKSVQLNKNNQADPFSQPINAKYNINGGLGCFGAYNVTRIDYEL